MRTPQGSPSEAIERYGYGCKLVVEHGEVTSFGHSGFDPGVSAFVSHHCRAATTIVVLCNYDRGAREAKQRVEEAFELSGGR